jgi:hypothetical protein
MVTVVATLLPISVGTCSLAVRLRRARGVERQQLRWLTLAAALVAVGVLAIAVLAVVGIEAPLGWLFGGCVALLPLATGASVLRYRLYDLDRIISRTLAYGFLTVLLGGAYAGVVLGLGQLLGQDSNLVVACATLAVAGAFQPVRRRVQQVVDRRFNRRRYDAAQTIQAFSERLREQVDLDTLTGELLAVVDQTMQPTRATLWLRPQPAVGGLAPRWPGHEPERTPERQPVPTTNSRHGEPRKRRDAAVKEVELQQIEHNVRRGSNESPRRSV